jgi:hypothetical protein
MHSTIDRSAPYRAVSPRKPFQWHVAHKAAKIKNDRGASRRNECSTWDFGEPIKQAGNKTCKRTRNKRETSTRTALIARNSKRATFTTHHHPSPAYPRSQHVQLGDRPHPHLRPPQPSETGFDTIRIVSAHCQLCEHLVLAPVTSIT